MRQSPHICSWEGANQDLASTFFADRAAGRGFAESKAALNSAVSGVDAVMSMVLIGHADLRALPPDRPLSSSDERFDHGLGLDPQRFVVGGDRRNRKLHSGQPIHGELCGTY